MLLLHGKHYPTDHSLGWCHKLGWCDCTQFHKASGQVLETAGNWKEELDGQTDCLIHPQSHLFPRKGFQWLLNVTDICRLSHPMSTAELTEYKMPKLILLFSCSGHSWYHDTTTSHVLMNISHSATDNRQQLLSSSILGEMHHIEMK